MPKRKPSSPNQPEALSTQLLTALTQAEIAQLLDALFQVLPLELVGRAIAQLDPNTQNTIQQILHPAPLTAQPASLAKLAQTWAEIWKAWDDVVSVASEEEGKYIVQEVRWEEPYFDNYSFAEDLDTISQQFIPLIETAIEHQFKPAQGFYSALLEAESDITSGIPEWMDIPDGIPMGEQVTNCLLQWEWQTAQRNHQDAFQVAQRIRSCEAELSSIGLDDDAIVEFFTQLPLCDQQIILAGLNQHKDTSLWRKSLSDVHSPWHELYLCLTQQQNPEQYLDQLRATISQNWENGLEVIEHDLEQENYSESLAIVQECLDSLLRSRHLDKPWTPETTLLVTTGFYDDCSQGSVSLLLQYYERTAQGLNQTERANALALQHLAFECWFDWKAMLEHFEQNAVSAATRKALLASWRNHIAYHSKPSSWRYRTSKTIKPWWVTWLLESVCDRKKGATWFQQTVTSWLEALPNDASKLGEDYDLLRLLTKDLTEIQGSEKSAFPEFYEIVIDPRTLSSPDEVSRRAYLQKFAPPDLFNQVMQYWKTNFHHAVPKPELAAKSDYAEHARSLLALKELFPESYETLLAQWKVDHQRRKNLWQALHATGLG